MTREHVTVDRFDGRETVFIDVRRRFAFFGPARPVLSWLLVGAAEPIDVWVRVPLTFDEADAFLAAPPKRYDAYVSSLVGRRFSIELSLQRSGSIRVHWTVQPEGNAIRAAMNELKARIGRLASSHRPHSDQAREVEPKLHTMKLARV